MRPVDVQGAIAVNGSGKAVNGACGWYGVKFSVDERVEDVTVSCCHVGE